MNPPFGTLISRIFDEDEFEGRDVFTRFSVGRMPYIAPDTEYDGLKFGMESYKDDWADRTCCYTKISNTWNVTPAIPEWVNKKTLPHFILQIYALKDIAYYLTLYDSAVFLKKFFKTTPPIEKPITIVVMGFFVP